MLANDSYYWVGLGPHFFTCSGLGWVESHKMDPWTTLHTTYSRRRNYTVSNASDFWPLSTFRTLYRTSVYYIIAYFRLRMAHTLCKSCWSFGLRLVGNRNSQGFVSLRTDICSAIGMGIPWESYGNKTPTWEWERKGVRMNADGNGNDPYSNEKKSHGFVSFRTDICSPLRYSAITDITFWRMTVEIFLSDFQSITNVFRIFIFQGLMSSFLWNRFYVARLSNVCTYTLLFCCVCLGMGWERESHGNWNEWKLTAWDWEVVAV